MKKRSKQISVLLALLLLCLSIVGCSRPSTGGGSTEANGEGPILVRIGHTDTNTRSTNTWSLWLGEYLEKEAPGRFKVEVYPDGQLGDSPDLVAGIKQGVLEIAFDLSAVVSAATGEEAACIDLPYLFPTYEAWEKGMFEKGGLDLYNEILAKSGYYAVDMYYNGMRQVISSKKNYHTPEDLNGQKVRISQNELDVETWKAMGGNPTPMAWGEVITSLSQGTIDALDHSLGVFNDFSLHEMAPYVTLTNHASSPFPVICSLEWIESLAPEDRAVLEEGIHQMCAQQRKEERAKELEYIARFKSENATVEELTPEEVAVFQERVKPVYELWKGKVGDEIVNKWLDIAK